MEASIVNMHFQISIKTYYYYHQNGKAGVVIANTNHSFDWIHFIMYSLAALLPPALDFVVHGTEVLDLDPSPTCTRVQISCGITLKSIDLIKVIDMGVNPLNGDPTKI